MQSSSNRHQSKRRSENEATSSNLQTSTNHYPFSDQSNTLLRPSNSGASFNAALHLPTDTSGRLLYQTPPPPSFNSVPFFDEFFDEELELLPVWSNDCPQGNELQYETHTSMPALNAFFFDLQRLAGTVQDVFIIPQNNPYTGSLPVPHSEAFGLVGDANLLRNDTAPVVDKYRQPNQAVTEYEWRLESLWADLGLPSQLSEKANIAPPYLDLPSVPNLSFSVESSPGPSGLETVLSWSRKGVDTSVDAVYDSDVERRATITPAFTCPKCSKQLQRKNDLLRHMKELHAPQRKHKCPDCNQGFKRRGHLRSHMNRARKCTGNAGTDQPKRSKNSSDRSGAVIRHTNSTL